MNVAADLSGKRVLVLEDDYFLARDAERALKAAGAIVGGPYAREAAAISAIAPDRFDAALVDINVSAGPSFETAKALRKAQIPFVFVTGYDQAVIPDEFGDVQRFEKPAEMKRVLQALADLVSSPKG